MPDLPKKSKGPKIAQGILFLYIFVMIVVIAISFSRRSGSLGVDMAKIQQLRAIPEVIQEKHS